MSSFILPQILIQERHSRQLWSVSTVPTCLILCQGACSMDTLHLITWAPQEDIVKD